MTGTITVDYKITSAIKKKGEVYLHLQILNPEGDWNYIGCKMGTGETTEEALTDAIQRAEEAWRMDLSKTLKTA
jgi:hypothetical protein